MGAWHHAHRSQRVGTADCDVSAAAADHRAAGAHHRPVRAGVRAGAVPRAAAGAVTAPGKGSFAPRIAWPVLALSHRDANSPTAIRADGTAGAVALSCSA